MKSIKTGNTLNVAVIGGGFFGMYIAEFLANKGHKVNLYEKGNSCMSRASYNNQARIHNGYHYPRSLLTAQRSRISFSKFNDEFKETVEDSYKSYYLIGRMLSKVTAKQFENFCKRHSICFICKYFFILYLLFFYIIYESGYGLKKRYFSKL